MFITALHTRHNHSIIRDGLVRWYPMDEGTGGTLRDMAGGGYSATLYGTYGWESPGVDFDGSSGYASFARDDMPRNSLTVMARIRPDGWGDANFGRIIHWGESLANGWWFYVNNSGGGGSPPGTATLSFTWFKGPTGVSATANNSVLALGTAAHVCVRRTPGTGIDFFVNGIHDVLRENAATDAIDASATATPRIGARVDNNRWFNGMIADVRVYNRALSNDEIAAIAAGRG
jgi:hypothetical protein